MRGIYKITHNRTGKYFLFAFNGKGEVRPRALILLNAARKGKMNRHFNTVASADNDQWRVDLVKACEENEMFQVRRECIVDAIEKDGDLVVNFVPDVLVRAA